MKNMMLALVVVGSLASGCASGGAVGQRGAVVVKRDTVKAFAVGPSVIHAFTMDQGGNVFLADAKTGTDADCAQARSTGRTTAVQIDRRNVVELGAGQVACVATSGDHPLELLWHAQSDAQSANPMMLAQARH
jgi:hypothetical protein